MSCPMDKGSTQQIVLTSKEVGVFMSHYGDLQNDVICHDRALLKGG